MLDYEPTAEQELPARIEFETELEREAQRTGVLFSALQMVFERQGIETEGLLWENRHESFGKQVLVTLPDARQVLAELVEQREWVALEGTDPYWTEWGPVTSFKSIHQKLQYRAKLGFLP